jgi:phosphate transport system substrate-binding protein
VRASRVRRLTFAFVSVSVLVLGVSPAVLAGSGQLSPTSANDLGSLGPADGGMATHDRAVQGARGEGKPHVRVTPAKRLIDIANDGQFVRVSWKGFPKNEPVYALECQPDVTDARAGCSRGGGYFGICGPNCPGIQLLDVSDRRGSGQGVARVAIGWINSLTPKFEPVDGVTFTCDDQNPCSLVVGTDITDLSSSVEVPLSFLPPITACPDNARDVPGGGASAAFRFVLNVGIEACHNKQKLLTNYLNTNGDSGIRSLQGGFASYAVTGVPLDDAQRAVFDAAGESVAYAPVSASGLVFAYRMIDPLKRQPIRSLTLTPSMLARIFTGQYASLRVPEIQRLNPGVTFPQDVVAFARGDTSEDNLTVTSWFWHNARRAWISAGGHAKSNPFALGPSETFPVSEAAGPRVSLLTYGLPVIRSISVDSGGLEPQQTALIGYVDSSLAEQYQLSTVRIRLPNGNTVSATPATIRRALGQMRPAADGFLQPDVSADDGKTWPMPTLSYAVVPQDTSSWDDPPTKSSLDALRDFLTYVAGPAQGIAPGGYVPLPDEFREQTLDAASHLTNGVATLPLPPPDGDGNGDVIPPDGEGDQTPIEPVPPAIEGLGDVALPPVADAGTTDTTSDTPVVVAASTDVPPQALLASGSRIVLPLVVILGIVAAIGSAWLFFGDRVAAGISWIGSRVPRPALPRRRGAKEAPA